LPSFRIPTIPWVSSALSVKVSTTGKVSFVVRFRYDGSRNTKRVVIGSYPRMSHQSARTETERLRGRLEEGHDPRIVRRLRTRASGDQDLGNFAVRAVMRQE